MNELTVCVNGDQRKLHANGNSHYLAGAEIRFDEEPTMSVLIRHHDGSELSLMLIADASEDCHLLVKWNSSNLGVIVDVPRPASL